MEDREAASAGGVNSRERLGDSWCGRNTAPVGRWLEREQGGRPSSQSLGATVRGQAGS